MHNAELSNSGWSKINNKYGNQDSTLPTYRNAPDVSFFLKDARTHEIFQVIFFIDVDLCVEVYLHKTIPFIIRLHGNVT